MGRKPRLTEYERGQIDAKRAAGLSVTQISKDIGRSFHAVKNYVDGKHEYGTKTSGGRPKSLSERDKRHIISTMSNQAVSVMAVKASLDLPVSERTIRRCIEESGKLQHRKMKKRPKLTEAHKLARVSWARIQIEKNFEWKNVSFSDEKKFNLDGPDGFAYYWHDIRKDEKVFSKRVQGGGSIMVWGCFGYNGTRLVTVSGRMTAVTYTEMLDTEMLPFLGELSGPNCVFQQDNAPIHDAYLTRQCFRDNDIEVLPWPSCSPDLNPIENVWGMLVRAVYQGARQYASVAELQEAIYRCWSKLDMLELQNLIEKMPRRLIKVIEKKGGHTGY
jgi:transposase